MSSFPGGPFPAPVFPPQDGLGAALGNVGSRVKTLEAVVPPTFEFIPDRPFALMSGQDVGLTPDCTFLTGVVLTPDVQFFDPEVFTDDSSGNLYLNKLGVYLITGGFSTIEGSADDYKGVMRAIVTLAAGSGGASDCSSPDTTPISSVAFKWNFGVAGQAYVTNVMDLPVLVSVSFAQCCASTVASPGSPVNLDLTWAVMISYLDGISPTEP